GQRGVGSGGIAEAVLAQHEETAMAVATELVDPEAAARARLTGAAVGRAVRIGHTGVAEREVRVGSAGVDAEVGRDRCAIGEDALHAIAGDVADGVEERY